eukprot:176526-Lingulodinium_polyedra.AAC.1
MPNGYSHVSRVQRQLERAGRVVIEAASTHEVWRHPKVQEMQERHVMFEALVSLDDTPHARKVWSNDPRLIASVLVSDRSGCS